MQDEKGRAATGRTMAPRLAMAMAERRMNMAGVWCVLWYRAEEWRLGDCESVKLDRCRCRCAELLWIQSEVAWFKVLALTARRKPLRRRRWCLLDGTGTTHPQSVW